jgi:hypothetical protein
MKFRFILYVSIIFIVAMFSSCSKQQATVSDADKQKLIKNLKDGFTGETTASAKYEAYSRKAKEEGFENIAKLFMQKIIKQFLKN